jgi:hypothetical protein
MVPRILEYNTRGGKAPTAYTTTVCKLRKTASSEGPTFRLGALHPLARDLHQQTENRYSPRGTAPGADKYFCGHLYGQCEKILLHGGL